MNADIESFEGIGVDPTMTYRGRFRGLGEAGEVSSAPFVFSPCSHGSGAFTAISTRDRDPKWFVIVQVGLDAAVVEVRAGLTLEPIRGVATPLGTLDLLPLDEATARRLFEIPLGGEGEAVFYAQLPDVKIDCANRLRVTVRVKDAAGENYPSAKVESACQRLSFLLPGECRFGLALYQSSRAAPPRRTSSTRRPRGYADRPARVTIEGGPPESPVLLDTFDFVSTPERPDFFRSYEVSVEGHGGETYPLRGRVVPHDPLFLPGAEASLFAIVDRAPPVATFLLPPEGGSVCLARDDAAPPLATLALADDASPRVEPSASWRRDGGPWKPLRRLNCDAECQKDATVPTGRPFALDWDAGGLDAGWYDLQMRVCDRSGNQGSTTRRVLVSRDAPLLQIISVRNPVFSPNGDGRVEDAQVTVRPAQAGSLSVRVHAGRPDGPLVRPLWTDVPQTATDVFVTWDGRAEGGQAVPDGEYWLVFSLADACGGATERSTTSRGRHGPARGRDRRALGWPAGERERRRPRSRDGRAPRHVGARPRVRSLELVDAARVEDPPGPRRLVPRPLGHLPRAARRVPAAARRRGRGGESLSGGLRHGHGGAGRPAGEPVGDARHLLAQRGRTARDGHPRLHPPACGARLLRGPGLQGARAGLRDGGGARGGGVEPRVGRDESRGGARGRGRSVLWSGPRTRAAPVYEEKTIRLELDRTPPAIAISRPRRIVRVSPRDGPRLGEGPQPRARLPCHGAPAGDGPSSSSGPPGARRRATSPALGAGRRSPRAQRGRLRHGGERGELDVPFLVDATPPRALIQSPARGAVHPERRSPGGGRRPGA